MWPCGTGLGLRNQPSQPLMALLYRPRSVNGGLDGLYPPKKFAERYALGKG
jgi:hypothetical protein